MRHLMVCCFVFSCAFACEDAKPGDDDADEQELVEPDYLVEPVVEVCTSDLCYSEAVPVVDTDFSEAALLWIELPEDGISYKDHKNWCEYFGWRMPTFVEIDALSEILDYYEPIDVYYDIDKVCDYYCQPGYIYEYCVDYVKFDCWGGGEYPDCDYPVEKELNYTTFTIENCGCNENFKSPYSIFARCVKSAA